MWKNRKTEGTDDPAAKAEPFKEYAMTLRDGRPVSVKFVGRQSASHAPHRGAEVGRQIVRRLGRHRRLQS